METVTVGRYVFVQEGGRLEIQDAASEHGFRLGCSGLLAVAGVAGSVALAAFAGPAGAWWLLATVALTLLGGWLLWRVIATGRTIWTFDRDSGELWHRGSRLRSLDSITHLASFCVEWPPTSAFQSPKLMHYVGFAPRLGGSLVPREAYGFRKDILAFPNLKDASQAATILAAFLGVHIIGEGV